MKTGFFPAIRREHTEGDHNGFQRSKLPVIGKEEHKGTEKRVEGGQHISGERNSQVTELCGVLGYAADQIL